MRSVRVSILVLSCGLLTLFSLKAESESETIQPFAVYAVSELPNPDVSMQPTSTFIVRSRSVPGSERHTVGLLHFALPERTSAEAERSVALQLPSSTATEGMYVDIFGFLRDHDSTLLTRVYSSTPGLRGANASIDRDLDEAVVFLGMVPLQGGMEAIAFRSPLLDAMVAEGAGKELVILLEAQQADYRQDFTAEFRVGAGEGADDKPLLIFGPATTHQSKGNPCDGWPRRFDEETGRWLYQVTNRPGNNLSLYYLFQNEGSVDGVPMLAYRNALGGVRETGKIAYFAINLLTGEEYPVTPRGRAGFIAEVVGEYLYCLTKDKPDDSLYAAISRFHLVTGEEEVLHRLEPGNRYSANLAVDAGGELVLFFHAVGNQRINLYALRTRDGEVFTIAEDRRMSHIQFSPVESGFFQFVDRTYWRGWRGTGYGWIDVESGESHVQNFVGDGAFFDEYEGKLTVSHPHWTRSGDIIIDFVDTEPPYANEYIVRFMPKRDEPDRLESYATIRLGMGEFQTHYYFGPNDEWFIGDGIAGDWWHKPGFGKAYVHKLHYDYANERAVQIPLVSNKGAQWTSGEFEANARYMPNTDGMVVWNAFRTLSGRTPHLPKDYPFNRPTDWKAREPDILYTPENTVQQNIFMVFFEERSGKLWHFSDGSEGWTPRAGITGFGNYFGETLPSGVQGQLDQAGGLLLSPQADGYVDGGPVEIAVRMLTRSNARTLRLYWQTTGESDLNMDRWQEQALVSNANGFTTYRFQLDGISADERLVRFMIAPAYEAAAGSFEIEYVRLMQP